MLFYHPATGPSSCPPIRRCSCEPDCSPVHPFVRGSPAFQPGYQIVRALTRSPAQPPAYPSVRPSDRCSSFARSHDGPSASLYSASRIPLALSSALGVAHSTPRIRIPVHPTAHPTRQPIRSHARSPGLRLTRIHEHGHHELDTIYRKILSHPREV